MAWQHRIVKRATRGRNTISVSFAFVVVVVCSSGGDCWTEECAQVESAAKVERDKMYTDTVCNAVLWMSVGKFRLDGVNIDTQRSEMGKERKRETEGKSAL